MTKVVFVHGVGKQYLSEDSLARDIVPELRGGARLAGGPVPAAEEVGLAFYGDLFRPAGTRSAGDEPFDAADVEDDVEFDLLMAWWAEAARTDPDVPGPDAAGTRGGVSWAASQSLRLKTVRAALDALTGARFLTGVLDRALIGDLKQMARYLTDDELRARARARVAARITPQTRVLVAHSLGSVVAYETLCNTAHRVDTFVTLGSPLGMRALVHGRLRPAPIEGTGWWPQGLRTWTNIADSTDVVAVVRELRHAFGDRVTDVPVHNGSHMHDATRYLTAVETGRAITAGLVTGESADEAVLARLTGLAE
ncbi:antibiotic ABC transporter ATP-binding protein [Embleya sp. NBC_00896]|uniref:antibiotic ABC transporter ATP-binding protein n=1 Tax=Embleya sp. NBC_00896 TaxID=2975961 RepID=UPI003869B56F|nr:antibiotic ABC transporter ATP-binding protein [Embleya sp. NBC_00896]